MYLHTVFLYGDSCMYHVLLDILQDALGQQLWNILGDTLNLVQTDPTRVVTAMKVVEREEK